VIIDLPALGGQDNKEKGNLAGRALKEHVTKKTTLLGKGVLRVRGRFFVWGSHRPLREPLWTKRWWRGPVSGGKE